MGSRENLQKFTAILARVLGVSHRLITDEASAQTIASWDSYNALMLVSQLEIGFQVKFKMEEVVAVENVGDLKALLRSNGIEL